MAATPLTSPSSDDRLWTRRFFWLVAGMLALRVVCLFTVVDFQLSGDESYYWDWGRRPDWCYYSKPPLIGWLMTVLRLAFGYHWQVVRLAAMALGSTSLVLLFALGKKMFGARTGFIAALMLALTPANLLSNLAFTIDSPLLLCWTAALLAFWLVLEKPESLPRWLALTLVIGIGTLAKQMMLAFPGMMLLFALCSASDRALLKRPAFWLCILGGLCFLAPVLWWNARHGWVTLAHTSEHFHHKKLGFLSSVGQFLLFPLLQAGVYSPITFGVLVAALVGALRAWKGLERRRSFLLMFSAPGLAVFILLALRQNINPNWPAVFYLSAFVLAAEMAQGGRRLEVWMHRGLKLGGAVTIAFLLTIPAVSWLGWQGDKRLDFFASMRGWEQAGSMVGKLYATVPRPDKTFVLVLEHRYNASEMAFHMPQHPRVYRWPPDGRVESQYEVWPNGADKIGWDCLVIYPDSPDDHYKKKNLQTPVAKAFTHTQKLGDADVIIGHGLQRSFQVFLCSSMRHWPDIDVRLLSAPKPDPAR